MLINRGFHPLTLFFLVFLALFAQASVAAPSMAMGYTPKYGKNFTHFEYTNPQAPKGGRVVLAGVGAFDSFNPFILKGTAADGLGELVFDTLMASSADEPFSKYALIANDISLAGDGLSVTFGIDRRARFSNGDPVTAEEVKFSFDTLVSDQSHPQFKFIYADVKQAVVLDKYTIRFDFHRTNSELHLVLANIPVFSPKWLNGKSFDKLSEEIPIASGPYTIAEYDLGKRVTYKRDPNYWAADLPVRKGQNNFDEVVFKYYQDLVISLEAFKAGEFDFRHEFYSKLWAREHNGPNYDSGEIIKTELPHKNNAGMQGFVFNTRRELFRDQRVRRAIALAFDFEWSNKHLFYNQYVVNDSYFANTELASSGLPEGDELQLLNKYRKQLPDKIFTTEWYPPSTKPPASLRKNLRRATALLKQAGWQVKDGVLVNEKGRVFEYEVLLRQRGMDRILAPYARNLAKLGIKMTYRMVDRSLYIRRLRDFDFDMIVGGFGQSMSPGNELRNMFHSEAADREGSQNYMGVRNPVVDELVEHIINARNRKQLITACHALDRVLLHGDYLVPNWYINKHRVAYWDKFAMPEKLPLYYNPEAWALESWWIKQ